MTPFIHHFPGRAKRLALTAFAVICLAGLGMQPAALAAANPATNPPANTGVAPAGQTQAPVDQDIRDIRPPYSIPPGWLWLVWAAGGLAVIALGYGAWRLHRRRGGRVKLPYELALEQLDAARKLMQPEQARAFSIAVSEVVRDYIEISFPVRASHRTTNEFLRDLATRSDSPLIAHQPILTDFLHHCDLAKFARWILSVPQMESMLQSASRLHYRHGQTRSSRAGEYRRGRISGFHARHNVIDPQEP